MPSGDKHALTRPFASTFSSLLFRLSSATRNVDRVHALPPSSSPACIQVCHRPHQSSELMQPSGDGDDGGNGSEPCLPPAYVTALLPAEVPMVRASIAKESIYFELQALGQHASVAGTCRPRLQPGVPFILALLIMSAVALLLQWQRSS